METRRKEVVEEIQQLNEVTLAVEKERSTEIPPRPSALKSTYFPILFLFLALFHHDQDINKHRYHSLLR
jgi:hypothetical protein